MPRIWNDPTNDIAIFMVALPWAITECVRYPFYQFKGLQEYLGHLRYNLFIVLYPIGVTGELLCCYRLYQISLPLARKDKPYTFDMPNMCNFAFDFETVVMYILPVVYLFGFPPLYMYMLSQRKKFYATEATAKIKKN
jgi:very-long-chain (3R)-3-hydroxyacyl-CoA dehydratase